MEIFHEVSAFKDLGVTFVIGRDRIEIAGPIGPLGPATDFRNRFTNELGLVLMAGADTKMLLALDFLRWRVEEREDFGPLPGLRVIRPAARMDDS